VSSPVIALCAAIGVDRLIERGATVRLWALMLLAGALGLTAVPAVASLWPSLDVRLVVAASPLIAVCAAIGVSRLTSRAVAVRLFCALLLVASVCVAAATIHEALFLGYR
jgi:hypothetical protein